jgi:hypothetical protein
MRSNLPINLTARATKAKCSSPYLEKLQSITHLLLIANWRTQRERERERENGMVEQRNAALDNLKELFREIIRTNKRQPITMISGRQSN